METQFSSSSSSGAQSSMPFEERYELLEKLGEGAYSVVRKAKHRATGAELAVKCIDKKKLKASDVEELKVEVALLKEVDHPNLLRLILFDEDERHYYIVTELLLGGELFDRIVEKEYYSERDAQVVMRTLGSAIKYLHDKGIVHRDLKPENIILSTKDQDASIKIVDFGFAKRLGSDGLKTSLGTPGYVAPELLKGQAYDTSVDMWAMGVILYILLCGYPPFYDENQAKLFEKIKTGMFQFDEPYWNGVSADAKDLISRLLCVDPKRRLTIQEVLKHPWMAEDASEKDITPAIKELRQYLNRRRFRAGVHGVIALNKLKVNAMSKMTSSSSGGLGAPSRESSTSEKST